jgi:hypothetical protein
MSEKPADKDRIRTGHQRYLGKAALDLVKPNKPKSRKVKSMNFHFRIGADAKPFSLPPCDVGRFGRYEPRYRLLLSIGQSYGFEQDTETRNSFIERMFNKGATHPSAPETLAEELAAAEHDEQIEMTDIGWKLCETALEALNSLRKSEYADRHA